MIAIVGGGCSGLLVAAQLMRRSADQDVVIFEPREDLGRGVAYSTPWPEHLLNAPADQMSALSSEPAHFVDWLDARHWPGGGRGAFVPRHLYGDYLQDVLRRAIESAGSQNRVTHVRATVVDLAADDGGVTVTTADGVVRRAASAVLALGGSSPSTVAGFGQAHSDARIFASAWEGDSLRLASTDERVLLVGSGLTAIDAMLALESQGHTGALHLVSRRGRVPQGHRVRPESSVPERQSPSAGPAPTSLRGVYRATRARIRRGADWREVVDGLRSTTNDLWRGWSVEERGRFLRHVKIYWDSHRHRMAPAVSATLDRCRRSGRFLVHAGRIRRVSPAASGLQVQVVLRAGGIAEFEVDRVIDCTGIAERYAQSRRPLIRSLLSKAIAHPNAMGTGFAADADGALLDAAGLTSDRLFTIGPPRYGDLLETIAVAEIRAQAERIAERL